MTEHIKRVQIENEKNVTAEDIVREADEIWKKTRKVWKNVNVTETKRKKKITTNIAKEDMQVLHDFYATLRKEHPEITSSYPTVIKHMVFDKAYHTVAFRRYLKKVERTPWTNDSERMDSYADYFMGLYREMNKSEHLNATTLGVLRRDYRKRLQDEHENFMKDYDAMKKQVEDEEAEVGVEKRKTLVGALRRLAPLVGVSPEQLARVEALVEKNIMTTAKLEALVYDMRRVYAGEDVETIQKEYQDHQEKVRQIRENTSVQIPESMPTEAASAVQDLAKNIVTTQE